MDEFVMPLPGALDVVSLTMGLVNIESETGGESALADSVEKLLRLQPHLVVERLGNTVVARTELGHTDRTIVVGHLDTVPVDDDDDDALAYVEMGKLFGPGACDMKGGLAVMLKAAALGDYRRDVTLVLYAGQEGPEEHNGLAMLARDRPDLLQGDLAIVMEPTDARVEVADGASGEAAVSAFSDLVGTEPLPALGRVQAQQLAELGVCALSFGPGDPQLAHTREEHVPTAQLTECEHVLRQWLRG